MSVLFFGWWQLRTAVIMVVVDDGRWWVGLKRVSCDQQGLRGGGEG